MGTEKTPKGPYRRGKPEELYQLRISDHILDSLYGHIGITEVEKHIERLAIFKRLHSVSQLGLVNWIFPCALHTRYTHSIGVMHIAGQMAEHINQNVRTSFGENDFFDDCDIQIIRLAGLLHDIGHYPMSHNVEQAYKDAEKKFEYEQEDISRHLKYYVNCPDYLQPGYCPAQNVGPSDEEFSKEQSGSRWPHHESAGQKIVKNNRDIAAVIKSYFVLLRISDSEWVANPKFFPEDNGAEITDEEVDEVVRQLMIMIGNMIVGNYGMTKDEDKPWQDKYSAMVQLIHSDLDADNLDYLLRDATFSGTSYGLMDMGILLNCLTVARLQWESDFETETRYLVGVKRKGLGCVEQFVTNKFLAYTQMILNKYTSILEAMLLRIMTNRIAKQTDAYRVDGLRDMLEGKDSSVAYLKFSDHYIFEKLFGLSQDRGNLAPLSEAIVSRLTHSCAFDLADGDSESICAGTDEDTILEEMQKQSVYKEFLAVCSEMSGLKGRDLQEYRCSSEEKKLFSFRFEEYRLTRQIPLRIFAEQIVGDAYDVTRAERHYHRLATGIPILEDDKLYLYNGETNWTACGEVLPPLCVDCPQSVLHQIYGTRYVSLRKYKIEEHREIRAG